MFTIKMLQWNDNDPSSAKEQVIQTIPAEEGSFKLISPVVKCEMGNAGTFDFSVEGGTEFYDSFHQMQTYIAVTYDGDYIFSGRVLTVDTTMWGTRRIRCEGALAYFGDTPVQGVPESKRKKLYIVEYMRNLLDNHNYFVGNGPRYMILSETPGNYSGGKTSTDQEIKDNVTRKFGSDSNTDTKSALEDLRSYHGGYFRTRVALGGIQNGHYLDWMDHYFNPEEPTEPTIELGKNIIDFSSVTEVDNIFTILIPVGKKTVKSSKSTTSTSTESLYLTDYLLPIRNNAAATGQDTHPMSKAYVSVPTIARGDIYDKASVNYANLDFTRDDLNKGYHTIDEYANATNLFGWIYKTVTFEDADTQEKLFKQAMSWIKTNYSGSVTKFTIKAIDMHQIGENTRKIMVGDRVKIVYPVNNAKGELTKATITLTCLSVSYDLYNPENNSYTFGKPANALTKTYGTKKGKSVDKTVSSKSEDKTPSNPNASAWLNKVTSWLFNHKIHYDRTPGYPYIDAYGRGGQNLNEDDLIESDSIGTYRLLKCTPTRYTPGVGTTEWILDHHNAQYTFTDWNDITEDVIFNSGVISYVYREYGVDLQHIGGVDMPVEAYSSKGDKYTFTSVEVQDLLKKVVPGYDNPFIAKMIDIRSKIETTWGLPQKTYYIKDTSDGPKITAKTETDNNGKTVHSTASGPPANTTYTPRIESNPEAGDVIVYDENGNKETSILDNRNSTRALAKDLEDMGKTVTVLDSDVTIIGQKVDSSVADLTLALAGIGKTVTDITTDVVNIGQKVDSSMADMIYRLAGMDKTVTTISTDVVNIGQKVDSSLAETIYRLAGMDKTVTNITTDVVNIGQKVDSSLADTIYRLAEMGVTVTTISTDVVNIGQKVDSSLADTIYRLADMGKTVTNITTDVVNIGQKVDSSLADTIYRLAEMGKTVTNITTDVTNIGQKVDSSLSDMTTELAEMGRTVTNITTDVVNIGQKVDSSLTNMTTQLSEMGATVTNISTDVVNIGQKVDSSVDELTKELVAQGKTVTNINTDITNINGRLNAQEIKTDKLTVENGVSQFSGPVAITDQNSISATEHIVYAGGSIEFWGASYGQSFSLAATDLVWLIKGVRIIEDPDVAGQYKLQYMGYTADDWADAGTFKKAASIESLVGNWGSGDKFPLTVSTNPDTSKTYTVGFQTIGSGSSVPTNPYNTTLYLDSNGAATISSGSSYLLDIPVKVTTKLGTAPYTATERYTQTITQVNGKAVYDAGIDSAIGLVDNHPRITVVFPDSASTVASFIVSAKGLKSDNLSETSYGAREYTVSADDTYAYIKTTVNGSDVIVAQAPHSAWKNGWDDAEGKVSFPAAHSSSNDKNTITIYYPKKTGSGASATRTMEHETYQLDVTNNEAYIRIYGDNDTFTNYAKVTHNKYKLGANSVVIDDTVEPNEAYAVEPEHSFNSLIVKTSGHQDAEEDTKTLPLYLQLPNNSNYVYLHYGNPNDTQKRIAKIDITSAFPTVTLTGTWEQADSSSASNPTNKYVIKKDSVEQTDLAVVITSEASVSWNSSTKKFDVTAKAKATQGNGSTIIRYTDTKSTGTIGLKVETLGDSYLPNNKRIIFEEGAAATEGYQITRTSTISSTTHVRTVMIKAGTENLYVDTYTDYSDGAASVVPVLTGRWDNSGILTVSSSPRASSNFIRTFHAGTLEWNSDYKGVNVHLLAKWGGSTYEQYSEETNREIFVNTTQSWNAGNLAVTLEDLETTTSSSPPGSSASIVAKTKGRLNTQLQKSMKVYLNAKGDWANGTKNVYLTLDGNDADTSKRMAYISVYAPAEYRIKEEWETGTGSNENKLKITRTTDSSGTTNNITHLITAGATLSYNSTTHMYTAVAKAYVDGTEKHTGINDANQFQGYTDGWTAARNATGSGYFPTSTPGTVPGSIYTSRPKTGVDTGYDSYQYSVDADEEHAYIRYNLSSSNKPIVAQKDMTYANWNLTHVDGTYWGCKVSLEVNGGTVESDTLSDPTSYYIGKSHVNLGEGSWRAVSDGNYATSSWVDVYTSGRTNSGGVTEELRFLQYVKLVAEEGTIYLKSGPTSTTIDTNRAALTSATLIPSNIRNNVTIFGVKGTYGSTDPVLTGSWSNNTFTVTSNPAASSSSTNTVTTVKAIATTGSTGNPIIRLQKSYNNSSTFTDLSTYYSIGANPHSVTSAGVKDIYFTFGGEDTSVKYRIENLLAENIKLGVSIAGVTGTYIGSGGTGGYTGIKADTISDDGDSIYATTDSTVTAIQLGIRVGDLSDAGNRFLYVAVNGGTGATFKGTQVKISDYANAKAAYPYKGLHAVTSGKTIEASSEIATTSIELCVNMSTDEAVHAAGNRIIYVARKNENGGTTNFQGTQVSITDYRDGWNACYNSLDASETTASGTIPFGGSASVVVKLKNMAGTMVDRVLKTYTVDYPSITASEVCYGKTIYGVAGTYTKSGTQSSGSVANASNILSGYMAWAKGTEVHGSIPIKGATTHMLTIADHVISGGQYLSGDQTICGVSISDTLTAANVKNGVEIKIGDTQNPGRFKSFTGTYKPGGYTGLLLNTVGKTIEVSTVETTQSVTLGVKMSDLNVVNRTRDIYVATEGGTGTSFAGTKVTLDDYKTGYAAGWKAYRDKLELPAENEANDTIHLYYPDKNTPDSAWNSGTHRAYTIQADSEYFYVKWSGNIYAKEPHGYYKEGLKDGWNYYEESAWYLPTDNPPTGKTEKTFWIPEQIDSWNDPTTYHEWTRAKTAWDNHIGSGVKHVKMKCTSAVSQSGNVTYTMQFSGTSYSFKANENYDFYYE